MLEIEHFAPGPPIAAVGSGIDHVILRIFAGKLALTSRKRRGTTCQQLHCSGESPTVRPPPGCLLIQLSPRLYRPVEETSEIFSPTRNRSIPRTFSHRLEFNRSLSLTSPPSHLYPGRGGGGPVRSILRLKPKADNLSALFPGRRREGPPCVHRYASESRCSRIFLLVGQIELARSDVRISDHAAVCR